MAVAFKSVSGRVWVARGIKLACCAAIVVPVLGLLTDHLARMDTARLADAMRAISLQSIVISALFTALSLYAVSRYDRLAMGQIGLRLSDRESLQGGFAAISLGQTLGMGLLVGSVVRWRMYRHRGVSLPQAALVSGIVMAGFLLGFIVVLAVAVLLSAGSLTNLTGLEAGPTRLIAAAALAIMALFAAATILQPRIIIAGRTLSLPKFRVMRAQITLAAMDVIPAAIALWVLIPGEAGPTLLALIPVYLVALGIGLMSNAPGGLGVLELACLMALPVMPPENLMAALIAHRGIYYGLPALIAGAMLVARELTSADVETGADAAPAARAAIEPVLANSPVSEATLARLGDKEFLFSPCGSAFIMYAAAGNSLVALGDPVGPTALHADLITAFVGHARDRMAAPVFYKCTDTTLARAQGMVAARIGLDAVLDPAGFTTSGSTFRELRRKLRNAEKAGLRIVTHAPGQAPMTRFARISADWAAAKGGERGFSMGYMREDYLNGQTVFEARLDGACIGFMSVMEAGTGAEHCIDVMRLTDAAPDGAMHALVEAAITHAAGQGATRFSLAAVPFAGIETPRNEVERGLAHLFEKRRNLHNSHGLLRFKNAFRPDWEPRYTIAPSQFDLMLGLRDAMTLVHNPPAEPQTVATGDAVKAQGLALA